MVVKILSLAAGYLAISIPVAHGLASFITEAMYISDWIPVNYTAYGNFPESTQVAQREIIAGAQWLGAQGPWSVVNKTILPPTGNIHDYYSLSPYMWPDCSNVHNTTALTEEQIGKECRYYTKDGQFNPDRSMVNDTGAFAAMSDAIWFNVLAYKITNDEVYAQNVAHWIDTWFVNNKTYMTPNLIYAQVVRGIEGSGMGTHLGVLDLHCFTKIASGVLVLRALGSKSWTTAIDEGLVAWSTAYINWLQTSSLALDEKASLNNHGSFYFSQTASLQVLVGDYSGARDTLEQYFNGIYKGQISTGGEQPFEAERTRPYHYRSYNAGAIITINRIAEYIGWDTWNITTSGGATVKDAVDFTMNVPPDEEGPSELFPCVAAVAAVYGDPDGKYTEWLSQKDPLYPGEGWFFWNQPLSDSGIQVHLDSSGSILAGIDAGGNSAGGSRSAKSRAASTGHIWLGNMLGLGSAVVAGLLLY